MLRIGSRASLLANLGDKFSLSFASNIRQLSLARRGCDSDSGRVVAKLGWRKMVGRGPGSRQPTVAGCQGGRVDRSEGLRAERQSAKASRAASPSRLSAWRTRQCRDADDLRRGSGPSLRSPRAPFGSGAQAACFGGRPGISWGRCCSGCAVPGRPFGTNRRGRNTRIGIRRTMHRGEQVTPGDVHVKFSAVELWRGRRLGG